MALFMRRTNWSVLMLMLYIDNKLQRACYFSVVNKLRRANLVCRGAKSVVSASLGIPQMVSDQWP